MAKFKKAKSISKPTTSKKLKTVSKPKQVNRKKSQPKHKSSCHSLQLINPMEVQENSIEVKEEQNVVPQVYFGTGSPFLQSVVLCHILENHFDLFEQIEMRRVCQLWRYNVKHIWGKARSLVLTVKCCSMKPKLSAKLHEYRTELIYENFYFDSPTMVKGVELTIGKNRWTRRTIDLLGDLFRNIEHLTLFYELSCQYNTTSNLCYFLKNFTKVKSFSLIMPPTTGVKVDFLSRIFVIINDHLAPLHTLHIRLPYYNYPFPVLENNHFDKTLSYLQNFSLDCTVENLSQILQTMGKSLPVHWPMQSLSINVQHEQSLSPVETLFENNSKLSQIKRLELRKITEQSLSLVNCLLGNFTAVECLHLNAHHYIKFNADLIKALSKMAHLKELLLCDFKIQIYEDWKLKSLPNIRKLTILAYYNLSYDVTNQFNKSENQLPELLNLKVEPRGMYGLFLHSFSKQFPNLERLTVRLVNDTYDFEKGFSNWCFAEFRYLEALRLTERYSDITFTQSAVYIHHLNTKFCPAACLSDCPTVPKSFTPILKEAYNL